MAAINIRAAKPPKIQDNAKTALPAPATPAGPRGLPGVGGTETLSPLSEREATKLPPGIPRPGSPATDITEFGGAGFGPSLPAPRVQPQPRVEEQTAQFDVPPSTTTPSAVPNPFLGAGRGTSFFPAVMTPQTQSEAQQTKAFLRSPENAISLEPGDEFGGPQMVLLADGTRRLATADDIARIENNKALSQAIFDVGRNAANFTLQQALSNLDVDQDIKRAQIDQAFAQFEAELTKLEQLDPDLAKRETDRLNDERDRAVELIEARGIETRKTAQLTSDLQTGVVDRQQDVDLQLQASAQAFGREQNALDRALRQDELAEATRAAGVLETLQQDRTALEQQQFKLDVFQMIAASPEMLFFLGEEGIAQFGDLLGDGGQTIRELIERLSGAEGTGGNIQQFARLNQQEQQQEAFRLSATTGTPTAGIGQLLRSGAPQGIGGQSNLSRLRIGR